jgi:hypothetical protein
MLDLDDINIIEGAEPVEDELTYYLAIQRAINDGSAWKFQGSYGRAMMAAIESGACMLGPRPARDYWGNKIPARDEVKEGTKGSYEYVADQYGADWAFDMFKVN